MARNIEIRILIDPIINSKYLQLIMRTYLKHIVRYEIMNYNYRCDLPPQMAIHNLLKT